MTFTYQKDSYVKELKTFVKSCTLSDDGKNYEVILNDTIIFPEGGGQPKDFGKLNDIEIADVYSRDGNVIHKTENPIDEETEVLVAVNFARRLDHMQQHSGQHLLSAIADRPEFNFPTLAWCLGESLCTVDFEGKVEMKVLKEIETIANEAIRSALPVNIHLVENASEYKTRNGLPDNITGPIRMIEIAGMDENLCCGTHVKNLSDIQVVKVLNCQNFKGNTRITFVCGDRAIDMFSTMYSREKLMTKLLCSEAESHHEIVQNFKKTQQTNNKQIVSMQKELGAFFGKSIAEEMKKKNQKFVCLLREGGDSNFMITFTKEVMDSEVKVCFVAVAITDQGCKNGSFILCSKTEKDLEGLPEKVGEIIEGKFGGKKTKFQGKASNITKKNIAAIEELLKNQQL